jgi:hypothetical protein
MGHLSKQRDSYLPLCIGAGVIFLTHNKGFSYA